MRKIATLMMAVAVSAAAVPAAFAHDADIRSDVRQIQRDRAHLRQEVRERDWAAVRKLDRKIANERADLRHDLERHR
jgi:Ni/Co efflux regulator RcnB